MKDLTVRIVQVDSQKDVLTNVNKSISLSKSQSLKDINVVVFPELFSIGCDIISNQKARFVYKEDESFLEKFSNLAKEKDISIILGSIPFVEESKVFNRTLVIDNKGRIISKYDKIYLFPLADEINVFSKGKNTHIFNINGVKATSIICYDLRFPEILRARFIEEEIKVLFVPMQWPAPRTEVFKLLLQARAVENQCFVVSCNRVGTEKDLLFDGVSMVVGPTGKIIKAMGNEEGIMDICLDLEEINKAKEVLDVRKSAQEIHNKG